MTSWGLSKKAFWDVRFEDIDFEKHARFVIEKVFNYGSWADQVAVMNYYGLDRMKIEVISIPYLRPTVVSFLSVLLNIRKETFVCCKPKLFPGQQWDY